MNSIIAPMGKLGLEILILHFFPEHKIVTDFPHYVSDMMTILP